MASGPGLWTTFFYYFLMTLLIGSFTASQALHQGLLAPEILSIGILLGLMAGAGGTYLNRSVTWELPIQGSKVFLNRLEQALKSLCYEPLEPEEQAAESAGEGTGANSPRVYARSSAGAAFGGRLYVQIQSETSAQIMGRSSMIRRLKTLL